MKKLIALLLFALPSLAQQVIELKEGIYTLKVVPRVDTVYVSTKPLCGGNKPDFAIKVSKVEGERYKIETGLNYPIEYEITKEGKKLWDISVPTSSFFLSMEEEKEGEYAITVTSKYCTGKGTSAFVVERQKPAQTDVTVSLQPLNDPLEAKEVATGEYEIRYIESREDDWLKLKLSGLTITDVGHSLQSTSYTLNGWTDLDNCSVLHQEPIKPYTLYHLSKYTVATESLKDVWKAEYGNPKAEFHRSELFFYVVPSSSTWNPVGESNNPIGRPKAFDLPAFKLKNRKYGFEYNFVDESPKRLDELDITFNRRQGEMFVKLYSHSLSSYLKSLKKPRGFHDLTPDECLEFANTLPIDLIVAFDIEPPVAEQWIINYDAPNFVRNMGIVIRRLNERGAKAYNWLDSPDKSPNNLSLDGKTLQVHGMYRGDLDTYIKAYDRIQDIQKRDNPYSVVSTGYGYKSYDNNFSPWDTGISNTSPQTTYLKALDAGELWKRVFPDKDQVYFSWAFQEFDFYAMPPNHVVEIPWRDAVARRTDNKPLYPPSQWEDNMILGLLNARYLFYWSPENVGWSAENVSHYNKMYTNGFYVWDYEKGSTPVTGKSYIGKESMAVAATIKAAYQFSRIQEAVDGSRFQPTFTYNRADKLGVSAYGYTVGEVTNGSWYVQSVKHKQPFCLVLENNNRAIVMFQDPYARPAQYTDFEFKHNGVTYQGRTDGNRLFIASLN